MKLLMISGDRSLVRGQKGPFFSMLGEFSKHWERVDIICPRSQRSEVRGQERDGKEVMSTVFVHQAPGSLGTQPAWIEEKGQELIGAHGHAVMTVHDYPPFYNGIGAKKLSRRTGVPAVLELHHIVGMPHAASFKEWVARLMSKMYLRKHIEGFAAVRTVNGSVRDFLVARGVPAEKIHIVPSVYLDHEVMVNAKPQEKKFDLVFAARLVENKGLLAVLDAVAAMEGKTLLIIGDGPLRAAAEARATSLGISSRVTFTGWLPTDGDVAKAIASGKIFLMNSKSEGNPRVAVEAMALGVPVLATKVGIMPDVITEGVNGALTNGSAKDIATKATVLLSSSSTLAVMGSEAAKISARFEKKSAIKAYADFLKHVAARST